MVKLEDIPVDWSVTWTEQVLLNDADVAKLATVDTILAVQHDHTVSDVTDFTTEVQDLIDTSIASKSDVWHTHAISDVTNLQTTLDWKASSTHTHAISDVTNLQTTLDSKVSTTSVRTRVMKTAITTRTSTTTLASDPDVQFAVSANAKYSFRWKVYFTSNDSADFKFSFTWPATPTLLAIGRRVRQQTTTTYESILTDVVYGTSVTALTITGQVNIMEFDGILHNWANAGTFAVQRAQNTSNANNTSVLEGSYIEYTAL